MGRDRISWGTREGTPPAACIQGIYYGGNGREMEPHVCGAPASCMQSEFGCKKVLNKDAKQILAVGVKN